MSVRFRCTAIPVTTGTGWMTGSVSEMRILGHHQACDRGLHETRKPLPARNA